MPKLLQNRTKVFLKDKLGIYDNIYDHLEQLPIYDVEKNCTNKDKKDKRYWSEYRTLDSFHSYETEFNIFVDDLSAKLHHFPFDDVMEEGQFCVMNNNDGIVVRGCT